jgi:membrane dipeptidase
MNRRDVLLAALGAPLLASAAAQDRIPIADAHNHLGLMRRNAEAIQRLAELMGEAGVTLLSWAIVPDAPFLRISPLGAEQGRPIAPGDLEASFDRQLRRAVAGLRDSGVNIVRSAADLDKAAAGAPYVALTSEGAGFLEGGLDRLQSAHDQGLRHVQLVHYVRNPVGDLQTERPSHQGLSDFGKQLVKALDEVGMLIDLAHSTGESIDQALDIASKPMIWSHSFIAKSEQSWALRGYRPRALGEAFAKKIASRGGAVGLWGVGPSFGGGGLDGYASEIIRMIALIGADHVMFGSDQDGLPYGAVIDQLTDLRKVVDLLAKRGLDDRTLRAVAFGNYARCLRTAMV